MRGRNAPLIAGMVCLFAFSADAFGLFWLYLAAAALLIILPRRHEILSIPVGTNPIMLMFFAGFYSTTPFGHPGQLALDFLFPLGYLVGFVVVKTGGDHNVQLRRLILTLVAGMTTHGTLNAVTNLRAYGYSSGVRVLPDYWTNAPLTPTLQATFFIPLVGFAYYGVAMRQQNRALVGAITAFGLLVAAVYNLATASRTIFVVAAITFSISVLASLWLLPRRRLLRSIGVVGAVVIIALISIGLYQFSGRAGAVEPNVNPIAFRR